MEQQDPSHSPPNELEPTISPPYWQTESTPHDSKDGSKKRIRAKSGGSERQISLVDNTAEESEQSKACWARSARITEYVVVGGGLGSLGSYVVYVCVVETSNVSFKLRAGPSIGVQYIQQYYEG
jgi:hypothetical protein